MKTKLNKIITATAFSLLLPFYAAQAAEIPLDRVAAIVNDGIVLESELELRIQRVTEQLASRNTRLPSADVMRKQVLNRLIQESIQKQLAQRQGIRVSDAQLNDALNSIASQNGLTLEQFREALIAEGRDYAQAREQIRDELLLTSVQQNLVNRRIKVSEQELEDFLTSQAGQEQVSAEYQLGHILIATPAQASPEIIQQAEAKANEVYKKLQAGDSFSETAVTYSDAQNALKGGDIGWRKVNELPEQLSSAVRKLSAGEFSKPVRTPSGFHIMEVKDKRGGAVQMVEQRLVSHILLKPSEIRTPAQTQRQINDLYRRIQEGANFADLAKEFSDDPGSGSEGGSLGWTQNGQMVPEFEQVMNSTATGQVSTPFESRFGWHILTVVDKRTEDLGETMLENRARAAIRKRKFNEELTNWMREIRSQAYVDIKE